MRPRWRKRTRWTCSSTSAPTRSTSSPAPSWSMSAHMATAAPIGRTSSYRARPTPKKPESMSTPKDGRSSPSARCFRPGTRARIGRSCEPLGSLGAKLPFDSLTQLRAALAVAYPFLVRFDAIEPADASVFGSIAALGGLSTRRRSSRLSLTSISPIRSRAPLASWPNVRLWPGAFSARRRNSIDEHRLSQQTVVAISSP